MSKKQFKCPVPECGLDATFVRYECEEVLMPAAMKDRELKRKPPFGELGRNFLVKCPVHGEKIIQEIGHHITTIPKKSNKPTKGT